MPSFIGIPELVILLLILMVVFNKRLPALGRQLGGSFRGLRDSVNKRDREDKGELTAGNDSTRDSA